MAHVTFKCNYDDTDVDIDLGEERNVFYEGRCRGPELHRWCAAQISDTEAVVCGPGIGDRKVKLIE